jgi:alpha-tubulin suppressor-like RCC1 family protein
VVSGGRVECWGDNSAGQLGRDPGLLALAPFALPVPGLDGVVVQELRAAGFHTCARAGGDVYCWGTNVHGELADPSLVFSPPIRVELGFAATTIAVGRFFACALGDSEGVYCWGTNLYGERGSVSPNPGVAPTPVPLAGVAGLFGGHGFHACALLEAGGARCWGRNHFGQLGVAATNDPQAIPVRVLPLSGSRGCNP